MKSFGRFGFEESPARRRGFEAPRTVYKSPLEKATERIEELNQAIEGHEARIEYLEALLETVCKAVGVEVPEVSNL